MYANEIESFGLASSYNMYGIDVHVTRRPEGTGSMVDQEAIFAEATEAQVSASLEGLQTIPFDTLGLTALKGAL